jgi:hypothetical protein
MFGEEMYWIIIGFLWLVIGAYLLKRALVLGTFGLGLILTWLLGLVIIVTYAQQHDDAWEQYLTNGILYIGTAIGGFYAALTVVKERFQSLNQRLNDHINNEDRMFDQFEKRINDKIDSINDRLDRMVEKTSGSKAR